MSGGVALSALAWDSLITPVVLYRLKQRLLRAVVGLLEDGRAEAVDLLAELVAETGCSGGNGSARTSGPG